MEACWAHNPEVRGSKPRSAKLFISFYISITFYLSIFRQQAPVVQRADNVIHWISHNPPDTKCEESLHSRMLFGKNKGVSIIKYVALQKSRQMYKLK